MKLVILTGASGAGKTSIVQSIERSYPGVHCLHFDSIGVPSHEEMISRYGSGEEWQRLMTTIWLKRIRNNYDQSNMILFEGQMKLSYIEQALKQYPIQNNSTILIDCNDEVRSERLRKERNQPELDNEKMMNWARYLRSEAQENLVQILDTGSQSLEESVAIIKTELGI